MTNLPTPDQYILWREVRIPGRKPDKVPCDRDGRKIDPHSPEQWMSHADATRTAKETGYNVGFVLTEKDPYFVIDIDNCRYPDTDVWDERAERWRAALPGCAAEISHSGTGLHLWGRCDQSLSDTHRNRTDEIEFYTRQRFIALGTHWTGDVNAPGADASAVLPDHLVPRETGSASALPDDGPVPEYTGPADDDTLIKMMMSARASAAVAFGTRASFKDLWTANAEVLGQFFQSSGDEPFDRSAADAALCGHLAFWTGKDLARMERLWLRSELAKSRPDQKKLDRADYRNATIRGAAEKVQNVYSRPRLLPGQTPPGDDALPHRQEDITVGAYLTVPDMQKHFEGCVYIREEHLILSPGGRLNTPEQFRTMFGGHEFQMTHDGSKPTKDAFEAFTQNRATRFPKVERRRYLPNRPYGEIVDDEVNVFSMPEIRTSDAPVDRFLDLLSKMLPDERDREILLSWMAAAVQNRGKKFQWAVVIQGTEGNGKTFLLKCMEYAIGQLVCHLPNPEDMGEKYNDYIEGNLFIGVEEIHMSGRREILDRLKKYITNDRIEVRAMRKDKRMVDNLANWMFLTNWRDAVLKSRNDRRYAVFFTAQQDAADLDRDGMTGNYFPKLWDWARGPGGRGEDGGFAAIAGFLQRYEPVAAYNPAGSCHRAPETSSTHDAVQLSLGPMEQMILEAIEQGMEGFRGGWVSSIKVSELLRKNGRAQVTSTVMNEAVRNIGYERCTLWPRGRASKPILQEGNLRPILYCKPEINRIAQSIEDYMIAQNYVPPGENTIIPFKKPD